MKEKLILDVGNDVEEFKHAIRPFAVDVDGFTTEQVEEIIDYIVYEAQAEANIVEYLRSIEEAAIVVRDGREVMETPEAELNAIKEAAGRLADSIFKYLQAVGAYDHKGFLPFKFDKMLLNDVVLEPLGPDDFGVAVDDDDASDADDIEKLYGSIVSEGDEDD